MKEKPSFAKSSKSSSRLCQEKLRVSTKSSGMKADYSNTKTVPSGSDGSTSKATTSKPGGTDGSEASKRKLPPCLFPGCKKHHLVRDHPVVTEEQAK